MKKPRVRTLAATGDGGYRLRARGNGKLRELLQIFRIDVYAQPEAHGERHAHLCVGVRTLVGSIRVRSIDPMRHALLDDGLRRRTAVLTRREAHVARGHDGGDGVFVDHLTHTVLQQHDELIERVDLSLQLDTVDEVDGNRDTLFTQSIQKGSCSDWPLAISCSPYSRDF